MATNDVIPSAGLSTEVLTLFRAHDLKKISYGSGLDARVAAKRKKGCLVDYKVSAALYFHINEMRQ